MSDAFKELLKGMSDHEINALDPSTLDDDAREALAIEVANRNRANEMREIEEAIERGSSVQQGNTAPRKFMIGIAVALIALVIWVVL
tara:strand:- start:246 stop:506 length:261 start_codon:yes stop_codon:yes gene_type:complete